MNLFCWLLGFAMSFGRAIAISGHDYSEESNDGNTQVLRCTRCGHGSSAWMARRAE